MSFAVHNPSWRRSLLFVGLAIAAILAGCAGHGGAGGGGTDHSGPYRGKTYAETTIPVGTGKTADLSLTVSSADGTISGTLTSTAALPGAKPSGRDVSTVYHFTATITTSNGVYSGAFSDLTNSSISGNLPGPPSLTGGNFTIDVNGTNFGPHPFGGSLGGGNFYRVDIIQPLANSTSTQPFDINDSGTVVGSCDVGGGSHSIVWTRAGGTVDLNVVGRFSHAVGISNGGQIAGIVIPPSGDLSHPHPYLNGTDLGLFGAYNAFQVVGITEGGIIIGEAYNLGQDTIPSAVVKIENGTFTDISFMHDADFLGMSKHTGSVYGDVYDPHHISQYWKSTGGAIGTSFPSTIFDSISTIASVPEFVMGPNDEVLSTLKSNGDAAILTPSSTVDLGVGGQVFGLNTSGVAVGNPPFIWTAAGGSKSISTLIDPASGITITRVWGINNVGQIIAQAANGTSQGVGVVLTPPSG